MLHILESFQTLIAGALVFLGVVLTLWFNAWIARKNRAEELKSEKSIVQTALIQELKVIKGSIKEGAEKIEEAKRVGATLAVPRRPMLDVYNTYLPRLGLLEPRQLERVLAIYLHIIELHRGLTLYPNVKIPDEYRVLLRGESLQRLAADHKNLMLGIDEAISCLEWENAAAV